MSTVFLEPYSREHILNIQRALNELCYDLPGFVSLSADGLFGPKSIDMLKLAQKRFECPVTGVYESPIKDRIETLIKERFVNDADIAKIANAYGFEYAMVKAFVEVESNGFGFLTNTRATILFERHKFYKEVKERFGVAHAEQLKRDHPDICNTQPGGYLGKEGEWRRLEKAMKLSQVNGEYVDLAIKSASWGMGQIMGFNYAKMGYKTVYEMFSAAMKSEYTQIDMMMRFCSSEPGIVKAMKNKDFPTLAKLYNGPNYKVNNYDTKLKNAYEKYKG